MGHTTLESSTRIGDDMHSQERRQVVVEEVEQHLVAALVLLANVLFLQVAAATASARYCLMKRRSRQLTEQP